MFHKASFIPYVYDYAICTRFLSQKDIQIVAGSGCPTLDRKVVNSGKRLRAHVGTDEGNVCTQNKISLLRFRDKISLLHEVACIHLSNVDSFVGLQLLCFEGKL